MRRHGGVLNNVQSNLATAINNTDLIKNGVVRSSNRGEINYTYEEVLSKSEYNNKYIYYTVNVPIANINKCYFMWEEINVILDSYIESYSIGLTNSGIRFGFLVSIFSSTGEVSYTIKGKWSLIEFY